jgi:hypothetical protein
MPVIKIKDYETSIHIPLKSGHRLLFSTFKELFNNFNIEYQVSSSLIPYGKTIIFVRNPIDRFFSSYYWLHSLREENQIIGDVLKKYNCTSLKNFISVYKELSFDLKDFHYLSQSQDILYNNVALINEEKINYKQLYDNHYKLGYEIYRIEDVNLNVFESCKWATINQNYGFLNSDVKTIFKPQFYQEHQFLKFVKNIDEIHFFFNLYYVYFKGVYDYSKHHQDKKYKQNISESDYELVYDMFKDEIKFFGYK